MAGCRGVREFLSEGEVLLKLLYIPLKNFAGRWTMPVQNWKAVRIWFATTRNDRRSLARY
ncbi:MAG: hypothetical protein R2684_12095 [Pyrinomonadaceae bacterium]